MSLLSSLRISIIGQSHTGLVRQHNEDDYRICYDLNKSLWGHSPQEGYSLSSNGAILILADGMGGLDAGEIASRIAVEQIKKEFELLTDAHVISPENIKQKLKNSFTEANNAIEFFDHDNVSLKANMGTTLIVCWIHNNMLYVAWTGDSRAYLYNNNGIINRFPIDYKSCGEKLRVLTDDHSLVWNRVIKTKGSFTREDARNSDQSNVILKCIGYHFQSEDVEIYGPISLMTDDKILVCTDGLNSMLSDEEILNIIEQSDSNENLVSELITKANLAGGRDNITVALCDILSQVPVSIKVDDDKIKISKSKKINVFNTISMLLAIILIITIGIKLFENNRIIETKVLIKEEIAECNDYLENKNNKVQPKIQDIDSHLHIEHAQSSPELKKEVGDLTPNTRIDSNDNNSKVDSPEIIDSSNSVNKITPIVTKKNVRQLNKPEEKFREVNLDDFCEAFNPCDLASCKVTRTKVKEKFYYTSVDKNNRFKMRTLCNELKLKEKLRNPDCEVKLTIKFRKKCNESGNNNIEIMAISVTGDESIFK